MKGPVVTKTGSVTGRREKGSRKLRSEAKPEFSRFKGT